MFFNTPLFSDRLVGRRQSDRAASLPTMPRLSGAFLTLPHAMMTTPDTSELTLPSVLCAGHILLQGGRQPRVVDISTLYYIFSTSECVGMLIFCALALMQHARDALTPYVVHPRVRAVAGANVHFQSKQPKLCRREALDRLPRDQSTLHPTSACE